MTDNICVCCGAVIPEGRHVCHSCEIGASQKPVQTNGDRIRAMTDEELAEHILCYGVMRSSPKCWLPTTDCKKCMLEWLKSESKEGAADG